MAEVWDFAGVFELDDEFLQETDTIDQAKTALRDGFKEGAKAEALFRATVSERMEARAQALFWVEVYRSLDRDNPQRISVI